MNKFLKIPKVQNSFDTFEVLQYNYFYSGKEQMNRILNPSLGNQLLPHSENLFATFVLDFIITVTYLHLLPSACPEFH